MAVGLALGIAVRAVELINCRSLGLDEARLAVNIASRSFARLLQPLDLNQSAPPLFLWLERLATLLLGYEGCALRVVPFVASCAALTLMYPFAALFVDRSEATLATLIMVFCPLLITYTSAVKQYSVELSVAIAIVLLWSRAVSGQARHFSTLALLVGGAAGPWMSLTSVFVIAACWSHLMYLWTRRRGVNGSTVLSATVLWSMSFGLVYLAVYREASQNIYLRRFWELAFVRPFHGGAVEHLWKTLEDQLWAFIAGDPVLERAPYLWALRGGLVLVLILSGCGIHRLYRTQDRRALWLLCGPTLVTVLASLAGLYPVSPRLTMFLLPSWIVLGVVGLSTPWRGMRWAGVILVVAFAGHALFRVTALEPSRHFGSLVHELQQHRKPGEPLYVFARTLPAWIYYSTEWTHPDTGRVRRLTRLATAGGPGFENAPSRSIVRAEEAADLVDSSSAGPDLLGLPSGMEWREVQEHVRPRPDSGWVEVESQRIIGAANPGVWVLATSFYEPETELFRVLEHDAARRTFALLRNGSALVRYEFGVVERQDVKGSR